MNLLTLKAMKKYLLTFEFRYMTIPKGEYDGGHATKTVAIGVYDTLEEVVNIGNEQLTELSKTFDIRDKFKVKGLFGSPTNLVTNTCTRDKVHFFGQITTLNYYNLTDVIAETLEARKQYDIYIRNSDL